MILLFLTINLKFRNWITKGEECKKGEKLSGNHDMTIEKKILNKASLIFQLKYDLLI